MIYRKATLDDIEEVSKLQEKYHVLTISEDDKKDGFVTTLFNYDQFKRIIEDEGGLHIACDGDRIVAYAMAASWDYWKEWPLFEHMIKYLEEDEYIGKTITINNSYQYGPVCIDKDYRGGEVLFNLFEFSRKEMNKRFEILITFINKINQRSMNAHIKKVGLDIIKEFEFNSNEYYELAYDVSKKLKGSTI